MSGWSCDVCATEHATATIQEAWHDAALHAAQHPGHPVNTIEEQV